MKKVYNIKVLKKLSIGFIGICLGLTGCQETPEESSVVSKSGGLSENVRLSPLKPGETRKTDIPAHWQAEELRNKERFLFRVDLELEEKKLGNLPVIEMKNHVLAQEELEKLTQYFAKGENLYVSQPYTKGDYQNVISRIENREGIYAASYHWMEQLKIKQSAEAGMAIAPEVSGEPESAEVKFAARFVDEGYEKTFKSRVMTDLDLYENRDESIWFEADVGEKRTSRIKAEKYDSKLRNSSSFSWMEGSEIMSYMEYDSRRMFFEAQMENPFTPQILEQMDLFEARYADGTFDREAGKTQAEQILADLEIDEMSLASDEEILWFSKENDTEGMEKLGEYDDFWWVADPADAECGYRYTFSKEIGGLNVIEGDSAVLERTEEMYSPPFPVETITITVTESGVKAFVWEGMSEEVKTIAENTELLSFDKIQERLEEQIFYWYSGCTAGQPEDDPTQFQYKVTEAVMGYTYITAYDNPENAWLVPAWSFRAIEGHGGEDWQYLPYMIEALEGRAIARE